MTMQGEMLPNEIVCPGCGYTMDGVTGVDGATGPDAGSASICMQCGKINVFTVDEDGKLGLVDATAEVEREVRQDPRVVRVIELIQSPQFQADLRRNRLNQKD